MAEPKWTPAPWRAIHDTGPAEFPYYAEIHADNGVTVARLSASEGAESDIFHNADLITAAPDLYEALANMLFDYADDSVRKRAYVALAKARGDAPDDASGKPHDHTAALRKVSGETDAR